MAKATSGSKKAKDVAKPRRSNRTAAVNSGGTAVNSVTPGKKGRGGRKDRMGKGEERTSRNDKGNNIDRTGVDGDDVSESEDSDPDHKEIIRQYNLYGKKVACGDNSDYDEDDDEEEGEEEEKKGDEDDEELVQRGTKVSSENEVNGTTQSLGRKRILDMASPTRGKRPRGKAKRQKTVESLERELYVLNERDRFQREQIKHLEEERASLATTKMIRGKKGGGSVIS